MMRCTLEINLLPDWEDWSRENLDGPSTFGRSDADDAGVLQVSSCEYLDGEIPGSTEADLKELAEETGMEQEWKPLKTWSGTCDFGVYGACEFDSHDDSRTMIWYLSDGKNFIFATYIAPQGSQERWAEQAEAIVLASRLRRSRHWWERVMRRTE